MATQRFMRKTRIVCISDTHGQTPKLPKGDILIHAGDLTNQGGLSELRRSVEWLERADFEAKVVIAGNHDITLDVPFFQKYGSTWRYPESQDSEECRKLLTQSKAITYLEHEAATIHLTSPTGPQTHFTIFGSPYSPQHSIWAFQYPVESASRLWECIPVNADIVVTHTPPKGVCDEATKDEREGCEALLHALGRVRPLLAVCGHIHEARGVERVSWSDYDSLTRAPGTSCVSLVKGVQAWEDPGAGQGNKKQSLVNLSVEGKEGQWRLKDTGLTGRKTGLLGLRAGDGGGVDCGGQSGVPVPRILQPDVLKSTSASARLAVDSEAHKEDERRAKSVPGGVFELRANVESYERRETVIVNAAFLGPRIQGKSLGINKPIVVDVDLPVWHSGKR